ncbi:MAG: phage holin family protein [Oscillospiraceae bacterium]|nr:phage holin family protein [Oscillospiraceae bacterium]
MKYILMLSIVTGLAIADFITGLIKAYCLHDISSKKMRTGGCNKLSEIIIMAVSCGLEIGISRLGSYYHTAEAAAFTGMLAAGTVFTYILIMELISILENYCAISPDALWVRSLLQKLRQFERKDEDVDSKIHKT